MPPKGKARLPDITTHRTQNNVQHSRIQFGDKPKYEKDDPGLMYLDMANPKAPRAKRGGKPKLEIYIPGKQKDEDSDEHKPN